MEPAQHRSLLSAELGCFLEFPNFTLASATHVEFTIMGASPAAYLALTCYVGVVLCSIFHPRFSGSDSFRIGHRSSHLG